MVIDADCGSSGHPTCLQFTDIMMKTSKKYRWQCMERRTCAVCRTAQTMIECSSAMTVTRIRHVHIVCGPLSRNRRKVLEVATFVGRKALDKPTVKRLRLYQNRMGKESKEGMIALSRKGLHRIVVLKRLVHGASSPTRTFAASALTSCPMNDNCVIVR